MTSIYDKKISLISGTAHSALSRAISEELAVPLMDATIGRFPDGEIDIKVDDDLRGTDCFVLQPLCPPVNDNWIELLLLLDCLRRSSAGPDHRGHAVLRLRPQGSQGRGPRADLGQGRRQHPGHQRRGPRADHRHARGADSGLLRHPVDHLYAKPYLLAAVRTLDVEDPIIVTPDVGGVKMARAYAKVLGADLAIVDKRRISGSETAVEHIIGDVKDRNVVVVDDMISTGGSIAEASKILKRSGAKQIIIAVTHALFCGPAVERLNDAPIDRILITDTIPLEGKAVPDRVEVVSVAPLLAQAIHNIHYSQSVSTLFDEPPLQLSLPMGQASRQD